jgi:hypothetical protein
LRVPERRASRRKPAGCLAASFQLNNFALQRGQVLPQLARDARAQFGMQHPLLYACRFLTLFLQFALAQVQLCLVRAFERSLPLPMLVCGAAIGGLQLMSARNRALWGRALLLSALVTMTAHRAVHAQGNVGGPPGPAALEETEAQKFLKSLPRKWSGTSRRDCKTYEDKNIARLTPPFAASAARFLRAFVEVHGYVTITSAHRTTQEQACVCEGERGPCAGRPRIVATKKRRRIVKRGTSRHQDGIALDVRAGIGTDEEFACLHEFAQFNPQFGVRFPLGKRDRPHMELAQSNHTPFRLAAIGSVTRQVTPCAKLKIMLVDAPAD